ncbi:hypothetical protein Ocin01_04610 [Orchesella cincta]|uniref:Uncharacterized protein n=1 Tax=Orchesella cincta TaxID=48709 RepID=A0A1D2N9Z1_ORCCI|nr:hypothetical protein Ocin01_04610 [Orchesella cincta]
MVKRNCSRLLANAIMDEELPLTNSSSIAAYNGIIISQAVQSIWTYLIIFCGLLCILSAFVCLCRRNSGFGDNFTDQEWAEALAERMHMMIERNKRNQRNRSLPGNQVRRLGGFEGERHSILNEMEKVPRLTASGDGK